MIFLIFIFFYFSICISNWVVYSDDVLVALASRWDRTVKGDNGGPLKGDLWGTSAMASRHLESLPGGSPGWLMCPSGTPTDIRVTPKNFADYISQFQRSILTDFWEKSADLHENFPLETCAIISLELLIVPVQTDKEIWTMQRKFRSKALQGKTLTTYMRNRRVCTGWCGNFVSILKIIH